LPSRLGVLPGRWLVAAAVVAADQIRGTAVAAVQVVAPVVVDVGSAVGVDQAQGGQGGLCDLVWQLAAADTVAAEVVAEGAAG